MGDLFNVEGLLDYCSKGSGGGVQKMYIHDSAVQGSVVESIVVRPCSSYRNPA